MTTEPTRGAVLMADDDEGLLHVLARALKTEGYAVHPVTNGDDAVSAFEQHPFDLVLSDIDMPGRSGIELLQAIRARDLDIPVVLLTGAPRLDTAISAVEYGASHYLTKPVQVPTLNDTIRRAMLAGRLARARRNLVGVGFAADGEGPIDLAGLDARFDNALSSAFMHCQPIVSWSARSVFAYEALVRSAEPSLARPDALFDAADRLGRVADIGRRVRSMCGAPAIGQASRLFVNLHTRDLMDETLYAGDAPLSRIADRVVLEITERARLEIVTDITSRIARLRGMGFQIAIDDIGAGYAGLTSFAVLEPDFVKLDRTLVQHINRSTTKATLVAAMVQACKDLRVHVIAEGVETPEERDALVGLGCDLLQGFLFARPDTPFTRAVF